MNTLNNLAPLSGYLKDLKPKKFAYSPRKRMINPKKVYLMDTGFASLGGAFTENRGYLLENVVALEFLRRQREMFYFKERQECDFILQEGRHPSEAWQVCWEVTPRNEQREFKGVLEAKYAFGDVVTEMDYF